MAAVTGLEVCVLEMVAALSTAGGVLTILDHGLRFTVHWSYYITLDTGEAQRLKQFSLKMSICSLALSLRVLMLESLCSAPAPARKGRPGPRPPPRRLEAMEVAWGSQPGIIP